MRAPDVLDGHARRGGKGPARGSLLPGGGLAPRAVARMRTRCRSAVTISMGHNHQEGM